MLSDAHHGSNGCGSTTAPPSESTRMPPTGLTVDGMRAAANRKFIPSGDIQGHIAVIVGWLRVLIAPGQVFEVRGLEGGKWKKVWSGFFDTEHFKEAAHFAIKLGKNSAVKGVYFTLNPLTESILARRANRGDLADETAKDQDVIARRILPIDIDPERLAGISSTDEEKAVAMERASAIKAELARRGWPAPIEADSGNGSHLLYRIDLPADDGGIVKGCLETLQSKFGDDRAKIDCSMYNPARICKLYGTRARKGDHVANRPHRMSGITAIPGCADSLDPTGETWNANPVPRELLEQLAAEAPSPTTKVNTTPGSNGSATDNTPSDYPRLLVDKYLTDRGQEYHPPEDAGSLGTKFILKHCPFNHDHTGTSAAVFQRQDGALIYKCQHNSCRGNKWAEFRDLLGKPERHHYDPATLKKNKPKARRSKPKARPAPPDSADIEGATPARETAAASASTPADASTLPEILCNDRQLRDITEDARKALVHINTPPRLFLFGDMVSRVRERRDDRGGVRLEAMGMDATRGEMARAADWIKRSPEGEEKPTPPPKDVVADLLASPILPGIPQIRLLSASPMFGPDGELLVADGYHAKAKVYIKLPDGLVIPPVSARPSTLEIQVARDLLLVDLFGDFPFANDASRAHALAALLLLFVRLMIDGPTPIHLFDAPQPGTGKTLLIENAGIVADGYAPALQSAGREEEEWRKRITATLIEAPRLIVWDNINATLDSGVLAMALTSTTYKDRILGFSRTESVANQAVWVGTGNNIKCSREIARRAVFSRIDAKSEDPENRTGFKHPNLKRWAKENRGRLIHAALTLCQAWVAAGRPLGKQTLGMFESWAETMGGLLDVVEVPGLMSNAKEVLAERVDKDADLRAFVVAWWGKFKANPVGVADLYVLAHGQGLLDTCLGDGGERSQRTRLGRRLGAEVGRVFGGRTIERGALDSSGRQLYCLTAEIESTATSSPSPEESESCEWVG